MNNVNSVRNERNTGMDLFRIFSMFMIVIIHINCHGGIIYRGFEKHDLLVWLLEALVLSAVDCFALLSGYVGITSHFRFGKAVQRWLQVLFWSVFFTVVFFIIKPEIFSADTLIKSFFPIMFSQYWYFTAYMCMYLFTPFLNAAVDHIDKKQAGILVLTVFFAVSVLPTVFQRDVYGTGNGFSVIWLTALYVVGACVRRFDFFEKLPQRVWYSVLLVSVLLTYLSRLIIIDYKEVNPDFSWDWSAFTVYTSPTIFTEAFSLLMIFRRICIKSEKIKNTVMFFSPLAFGVYLVHEHPLVREYVIENRFYHFHGLHTLLIVPAIILSGIVIFIVCAILEYIRILLFKSIKKCCANLRKKRDRISSDA